jgi:hypothetical protein
MSPLDINSAIDATAVIAVPAVIDDNDEINTNPAIDATAVIAVPAVVDDNDEIDTDLAINATAVIAVSAVVDDNDEIDTNPTIDATAVIAVSAVINTDNKIDIDLAINTAVGIVVPSSIGTASPELEDDVVGSTITVPATAGGFDMAFRLFNFHVGNDGVVELTSVSDSMPLAMALTTSPVAEGNPLATAHAGGGIKAERFDPISRVERLRRSTSFPNHHLLRRLRRIPLCGCRRFLVARDHRL